MALPSTVGGSAPARTLARGLALLEIVAASPGGAGVTEVAAACGLDKGTASRLLASLRDLGYLRQNASDQRYFLTGRVMRLARGFSDQLELRELARPFLVELRDQTTETVHIGVRESNHVVIVDYYEPNHDLRIAPSVGRSLPLHVTAMGRAVLAALPAYERAQTLQKLLTENENPDLVMDIGRIEVELEQAVTRGWAVVDRGDHVSRVGAAVLAASGEPVAGISVSGPSARVAQRVDEYGQLCHATARAISAELGYQI